MLKIMVSQWDKNKDELRNILAKSPPSRNRVDYCHSEGRCDNSQSMHNHGMTMQPRCLPRVG